MSEGTETVKAKLVIVLKRTAEFKKLMEAYNKERQNRTPGK